MFTFVAKNRFLMAQKNNPDPKDLVLRQQGSLNPHPDGVTDELFLTHSFFDARDLVQVKYEMLRRVESDGQPVSRSAAAFSFSRPSFYQAQAAFQQGGLPALMPHKRGAEGGSQTHGRSTGFCSSGASAGLFAASGRSGRTRAGPIQHHGPSTKHRARSGAQSKKTAVNEASAQAIAHEDCASDYEQLRGSALGIIDSRGIGFALFLRNGMAAWVHACSCGAPPANDPIPPPATLSSLPADVRSQAAVILASIILHRRPETTHVRLTCRK